MSAGRLAIALIAAGLCLRVVHAQPADATLPEVVAAAEAAYDEARASMASEGDADPRGGFEAAAELYTRALGEADARGVDNAGLHYNRANALLMAGRTGKAVAAYLRAQRLAPGNDRIARNLRIARARVATRIDGAERGVGAPAPLLSPVIWAHRALDGRAKLWLFIATAAVFWALLGVRLIDRRLVARRVALVFFVAALVTSASVAADVLGVRPAVGVVRSEPATARTGPGESYGPAFTTPLAPGVEMLIGETRGEWARCTLADGRAAWVRRDAFEAVAGG